MYKLLQYLLKTTLLIVVGCASISRPNLNHRSSYILFDDERQRDIPIKVYPLPESKFCNRSELCPVAIMSPGYGMSHTKYSFLSDSLNRLGYLVIAVQHELPTDPPLATSGDLYTQRASNWRKGAKNIRFVVNTLRKFHQGYDWQNPILVGHSNGGDISAWLEKESPGFAASIITLDHRRVPLPRGPSPRVLSIRASDFPADDGVLPNEKEQRDFDACIVTLQGARHNDMHDAGDDQLKKNIVSAIESFLGDKICIKATGSARPFDISPIE